LTDHRKSAAAVRTGEGVGTNSFRRRVYAGLAALLVLAGGLVLFAYLRPSNPQKLIALAYVQQRTLELRIPDAGYAQIHVQRENGQSQFNKPAVLLEAEALIQRRLEEKPDDPELLRQTAEVDLLNRDYQPAIETLSRALRVQPNSFYLLVDLASAYFERAEGTSNPADYEAGLQYLGEAIRMDPASPLGLFNRAVMYERLYLYDRATSDWEQFLKLETDRGWKEEAGQRLAELRRREQKGNARHVPERLTLDQFKEDVKTGQASGIEEYLEAAERNILPKIISAEGSDPNYQAAAILADELKTRHADHFLADLLTQTGQPEFQNAVKLLGQSSSANRSGRNDEAYKTAALAAAIFQRSDNIAGLLASRFEQAYALQFESKADSCQALAGANVNEAHRRGYIALEVQLLLEQAICSNMNRQIGQAKILDQQALRIAAKQGYQGLYLRGLRLLAALESEAGNDLSAWSATQQGLSLYWSSNLPAVRGYSFYAGLDLITERLGHRNVQFAVALEALKLRSDGSNQLVEATERTRLAEAALRVGEAQVAESQLREAQRIFASVPQTNSVRWHELEARVSLARLEKLRGGNLTETADALVASLPDVERLSNRYLEFQYYNTVAELKTQLGDSAAGRQFLNTAIHIAEDGLRSLRTWHERLAWMDQHRPPYILLTQLLLRSGEQQAALDTWEHFRTATAAALPGHSGTHTVRPARMIEAGLASQHPVTNTTTLTYAFAPDGLMIWVRNSQELHSVYLSVAPRDLRRAAENFIGECARPNSDMSNLRADARYLYSWLIQPVRQWLPDTEHIIIEPDGVLGVVPMEALIDPSGAYLGTRYTFTVASSIQADAPGEPFDFSPSDHALIVAGVRAPNGSFEPPPGAMNEAIRVAEKFNQPNVLEGKDATVSSISNELRRSAVFHFAGHAGFGREGAAMLMADGPLGPSQIRALNARGLSALKLAVFSACGTARPTETSESDSLVTEFLQAGARNVVASRWNVDSVATADFMQRFYATVLSGGDIAGALQTAANAFRQSPDRAHPYYWAAFSAFGRA
jgi:CHAT domain-containing protein/Tfp pilus assembly protein PilF